MNLAKQLKIVEKFKQSVPVNLVGLAEHLGVDVEYGYLADNISGQLEPIGANGGYRITINSDENENRQRFTLAHELGHLLLHSHLIGTGLDDNKAYRSSDDGKYHNTRIDRRHETQANRFAAQLLMPSRLVEAQWKNSDKDTKKIAEAFKVSEQAMNYRLQALDLA